MTLDERIQYLTAVAIIACILLALLVAVEIMAPILEKIFGPR